MTAEQQQHTIDDDPVAEVGRLLGDSARMLVYVARSVPAPDAPPPPPTTVLAHVRYMKDLERSGVLFAGGGLLDEQDGRLPVSLSLLRVGCAEQAVAVLEQDPMHAGGYRTFDVERWRINLGSFGLQVAISDQRVQITG